MNKKFMNALLFSAALLSSGVVATSCKDYDDDIDELRNQDATLQSSLEEQLSAVESSISSLQTAQTNLQNDIDAAKQAADEAAQAADEAAQAAAEAKQAALDGQAAAIEEATNLLNAAKTELTELIQQGDNALQESIDAVAATLEQCEGQVESLMAFKSQTEETLASLDEAYKTLNTTVTGLSEKVTELNNEIGRIDAAVISQAAALDSYKQTNDAAVEEIQGDLADLAAQVDKWKGLDPAELEAMSGEIEQAKTDIATLNNQIADINAELATLYTAIVKGVTHVSLVVGSEYDAVEGVQNIWDNSELTLLSAKAVRSWTFGEGVVDNPVTFTEGERINRTTKFLIRVSPANATINDSDLQFIDSEGNDLIAQGIVTATIKPFEGVLTRSAVGTGNGLFEVAVSINNPYDEAKFTAATQLAGEKPSEEPKQRLFAVGIKDNTVKDVVRNVVSEYQLTFGFPGDETSSTLGFTVDDKNVNTIQNRATDFDLVDKDAKEYVWTNGVADEPIFEGSKVNVTEGDDRHFYSPVNVEAFEPFTIQLNDEVMKTATHFYVVVDRGFLDGSDNQSEELAWDAIEPNIVGINKMYDVAETSGKVEITINKNVNDIIGFRVYAVNSNGTLVDPDGRSFYVQIGKATSSLSWETSIEANKVQSEMLSSEWPGNLEAFKAIAENIDNRTSSWEAGFDGVYLFNDVYGELRGDAFKLNFYDDKGNLLDPENNAADWKKVATMKAQFTQDAKDLIDNYTYEGVYTFRDAEKNVLYTMTVKVTKTLPTAMPEAFKPKTAQPFEGGLYNCYLDWNGEAGDVKGDKDLASVFYGLKDEKSGQFDEAYTFTFADSQAGAKEGEYEDVEVVYNAAEGYNLSVGADFISDGKEHALTVGYNYGEISYRLSDDGRSYVTDEVEVENTDYAFQYVCVYDVQTWAWKKGIKNNTLTYRQAGSVTSDDIIGTSPVDKLYNASLTSIRKTFEALPADGAEVVLYGTVGNDGKTIDESVVNEYFIPEITHNNYVATINFKVNDAAQSDPGEGKTVNCIMRLTYKDKFGHDVVIELPVTIKSAIVSE